MGKQDSYRETVASWVVNTKVTTVMGVTFVEKDWGERQINR